MQYWLPHFGHESCKPSLTLTILQAYPTNLNCNPHLNLSLQDAD